ncbi:hypothetical protein HYFRA_00001028 [Hymenoscyphus fraxineus]|uniref:Uncharacterized protein n=1 Tax=Hymenoscyphus fraxineus TaxID=746836 RepID=A0A9N9KRQ0_9HELO|nr:hypothetical protein HYFRA_00001028 [Hymenoscyphus fraxineus]
MPSTSKSSDPKPQQSQVSNSNRKKSEASKEDCDHPFPRAVIRQFALNFLQDMKIVRRKEKIKGDEVQFERSGDGGRGEGATLVTVLELL